MARKFSETAGSVGQSSQGHDQVPGPLSFEEAFEAEVEIRRNPCRTEEEWRDFWDFVEFHSFGDELEADGRLQDLYDWCSEFWQPGWKTKGYNPKAMW